ncbi:MAG: HD domain-containing protein [Eubacterium sp.]|nr:HD domain-containing protein [Eubacterium sp.]
MRLTTFASIYIGTYDVTLEIFEVTRKNGIRSIDSIRKHLEIGTDTYATGKIRTENISALCEILQDYLRIAEGYQTEAVRAVAASSLREAENNLFIIGQIQQQTGLKVEILSNSEQRFMSYKAIAASDPRFLELMDQGTAIIDVGGGSIQVSIFDGGALDTTLNLRIGSLRIRDRLIPVRVGTANYERLVEEYISNKLHTFRDVHLKQRRFENVILNGDFITETLFRDIEAKQTHAVSRKKFDNWYNQIMRSTDEELAEQLNIPAEFAPILRPTAILYHKFVDEIGASRIYAAGASLSYAQAVEYAETTKKLTLQHDFDEDIISASRSLSRRYCVEQNHTDNVDMIAMELFNAVRKIHGLKSRDRLLLRIAVILHEVGKYISLNSSGECAYQIIMNNEIMGLSHREREMVALTVKHNSFWFRRYEQFVQQYSIDQKRYLRIAQLTALLRVANELDRSHMQKIKKVKASLKENKLVIRVYVDEPFVLEENLITRQLSFMNEVFNIQSVVKVTKIDRLQTQ